MIFDKILKRIFSTMYVNIIIDENLCSISVIRTKNGEDELIGNKNFSITGRDITKEAVIFIRNYINNTPYMYISLLNPSTIQGVMPTTSTIEYEKYINPLANAVIKIPEYNCGVYTSKNSIEKYKNSLEELELDALISPVFLIFNSFEEELNKGGVSLNILTQKDSILLVVIKNRKVLYSKMYFTSVELESEEIELMDEFFDPNNFLNKGSIYKKLGNSSLNIDDFDFNKEIDTIGTSKEEKSENEMTNKPNKEINYNEQNKTDMDIDINVDLDSNLEDILFNNSFEMSKKNYVNEMRKIKVFIKRFYKDTKIKFNKVLVVYTDIYVDDFTKSFEEEIGINISIISVLNIKKEFLDIVKEEIKQ